MSKVTVIEHGSGRLEVFADGRLRFTHAGGVWEAPGPFLFLHYYDRQHPRAQVVAAPVAAGHSFGTAGTPSLMSGGELSVSRLADSALAVTATFPNARLRLTLRVALAADGSGFSVSLDDADIREDQPRLYRLLGIELLPEFGAATSGEPGYLTLPNWMGCQTFFDKTYPREVRQTVYSSNDQWEHNCNMPVFGITRAQGTLCGLIAHGDYDAQLVCRVHWEERHANSVHPYLVYRWEQQDERLAGPREVRYAVAPANYKGGEGYVFCAKTCRQFLRQERGLLTWDEKARTRPAAVDYRDRFFLKIFMAYKEPQADGRGPYHATCTFAEARDILAACQAHGMDKITAILVGWGVDGHDGQPPTRFPVDQRLGGEAAFKDLVAWCRDHDVLLGVHDSYGGYYSCSPEFNTDDLIRHRTGEYWESVIWSGGQVHNACPKVYFDKHVKRDVPAIRALGIHGHHHIDAVGSFMPCYAPAHPLEQRADFCAWVRRMFAYVNEQIGSVSTEMPFGPYFGVVDGFFHSYSSPSPWHLASPIGRWFYDRTVPLLTVVLHGALNCGESIGKYGDTPWTWLDLGLTPEYEVCQRPSPSFGIPAYESKADIMAAVYALYYGPDGYVRRFANLTIEGRWELPDGTHRTRYSDGTEVVVDPAAGTVTLHS